MRQKSKGILLCVGIAAVATWLSGFRFEGFSMEIVGAPVLSILT